MINVSELSVYSQLDEEKTGLIKDVYRRYPRYVLSNIKMELREVNEDVVEDLCLESHQKTIPPKKYCPKCGKKYPEGEIVCLDCLVHLKNISDKIDFADIDFNPQFELKGGNSYDSIKDLLCCENLKKIHDFDFSHNDYLSVLHDIKSQAFKNFDDLIKSNEIEFDSADILDKVILFTKSFVKVEYKSYGGELGYFEDGIIYIDDRQTKSLQITTLIHELSHFLIKEVLIHILCRILDASKNAAVVGLADFILSYSPFTQLIDEYCAHNVEGRFTMFGFQDYSSYLQIEQSLNGEMSEDEIEITKTIGNTFAVSIKDILESLIDRPLREDIKDQFMDDVLDRPNYTALKMENCQLLNEDGFVKAIWLILNDGCEVASAQLE